MGIHVLDVRTTVDTVSACLRVDVERKKRRVKND